MESTKKNYIQNVPGAPQQYEEFIDDAPNRHPGDGRNPGYPSAKDEDEADINGRDWPDYDDDDNLDDDDLEDEGEHEGRG
jgi:hypothetical protein